MNQSFNLHKFKIINTINHSSTAYEFHTSLWPNDLSNFNFRTDALQQSTE